MVDKIAKESDNVGHNILNYYVTHQSDQDFQKHWIKLQRNIGMLKKEKHPLKWLAMSWRLSINKMAPIIDALSSTKYDDQRIARDLPVKVAHKIGDAYDFRHDVAIVYTNSPYVIAIFTDHSNYDTISNISKISMRY